jgi:transposase
LPWRLLPQGFPPRQTVYRWFAAWRDSGLFETENQHSVMPDRERVGREAGRSAAKDLEGSIAPATAFLYAVSVMLLARRLGRCT